MNRRNFIATNVMASLATLPVFASKSALKINVKFFCPRWGATDDWDSFCKRVKDAGYDGVESWLNPNDPKEKEAMQRALEKYGLKLVGQYWQSMERDVDAHAKSFDLHLRTLAELNPLFINAQTGKDYFTFEQNKRIIAVATEFTKRSGVKVVHETHRGKALFAAHVSRPFIEKIPDLRLTLDISHWCNVHESLLQDQEDDVALALSRTDHIHSRVGHQEGPQVSDPRAQEWSEALQQHLKWWDQVVDLHNKSGKDLTITTEFGPCNYMPALPYTRQPVASQWEVNVHMLNLLKTRYQ